MANSKKPYSKPKLAENPIADVFEGRHTSDREVQWAENTLRPTLEKSPEKPIGAPTGTNLDDHGQARFSTISNMPIRRLYTPADLPRIGAMRGILRIPESRLSPAEFTPPAIEASFGHEDVFRLRIAEETNARYKYLLEHGSGGLSVAFDLPTLMGYDSDPSRQRRRSWQVRRRHRFS
jgi:methylmalonyl-CoA mutase N-terminal domain/subunit